MFSTVQAICPESPMIIAEGQRFFFMDPFYCKRGMWVGNSCTILLFFAHSTLEKMHLFTSLQIDITLFFGLKFIGRFSDKIKILTGGYKSWEEILLLDLSSAEDLGSMFVDIPRQ